LVRPSLKAEVAAVVVPEAALAVARELVAEPAQELVVQVREPAEERQAEREPVLRMELQDPAHLPGQGPAQAAARAAAELNIPSVAARAPRVRAACEMKRHRAPNRR
jgi:hypothetical protein